MSHGQALKEQLKNLPNKLTLLRLAAVPVLVILAPWNVTFLNYICALVFGAAAITDYLDGYFARKMNATTTLGAIMDPVADKILASSALILLASMDQIPHFLVILLICRELAVSGLRLAALERQITISVGTSGKVKTAVQDVAIFCLFTTSPDLKTFGMLGIWAGLFLAYYSAYLYWNGFWDQLKTTALPYETSHQEHED